MASPSPGFMSCTLIMDTETTGWQKSMDKLLSSIEDRSYTLDAQIGYARVSGKIAPDVLLKKLAKVEKIVRPDQIDYGFDRYWDNPQKQEGSQEHASKEELDAAEPTEAKPSKEELDAAEPTEAKPSQAPLPAAKIDQNPKKLICCTVM